MENERESEWVSGNESDDGYRKWHHVHTVDDVATFQDFRVVCFVAFDEGYDHFSSYSRWKKKHQHVGSVSQSGRSEWMGNKNDSVWKFICCNKRRVNNCVMHTICEIIKMTIKFTIVFNSPGLHVYCFTLKPAISNRTTNCLACGPCLTLCSNASFIYVSNVLIVDRMKSARDTVCNIPHISMPANGTTITVDSFHFFYSGRNRWSIQCETE